MASFRGKTRHASKSRTCVAKSPLLWSILYAINHLAASPATQRLRPTAAVARSTDTPGPSGLCQTSRPFRTADCRTSNSMKIPEILRSKPPRSRSLASVLDVHCRNRALLEHVTTLIVSRAARSGRSPSRSRPAAGRAAGGLERRAHRQVHGLVRVRVSIGIAAARSRCVRAFPSPQQILRDIYTPGVARVCLAIQKDPGRSTNTRGGRAAAASSPTGRRSLGSGTSARRPDCRSSKARRRCSPRSWG